MLFRTGFPKSCRNLKKYSVLGIDDLDKFVASSLYFSLLFWQIIKFTVSLLETSLLENDREENGEKIDVIWANDFIACDR